MRFNNIHRRTRQRGGGEVTLKQSFGRVKYVAQNLESRVGISKCKEGGGGEMVPDPLVKPQNYRSIK